MKLKKYLHEEFLSYEKKENQLFGIYKNPNRREIKELVKEENISPVSFKREGKYKKFFSFRFIADKTTKNVFIFNYNFLHDYAVDFLELHKIIKDFSFNNVMKGIINYDIENETFDTYNLTKGEWQFFGDYIDKLNAIKKLNEEFYSFQKSESKNTVEIFKNPTFSELMKEKKKDYYDIYDGDLFRTIIDVKNKNVYIFHGALLHQPVVEEILKRENLKQDDLLVGFVGLDENTRKINATYIMINPYNGKKIAVSENKIKIKEKKYDFLRKYFGTIKA